MREKPKPPEPPEAEAALDKNGNALAVGDDVTISFHVLRVEKGAHGENVALLAFDGPEEETKPQVFCNSRLVSKIPPKAPEKAKKK